MELTPAAATSAVATPKLPSASAPGLTVEPDTQVPAPVPEDQISIPPQVSIMEMAMQAGLLEEPETAPHPEAAVEPPPAPLAGEPAPSEQATGEPAPPDPAASDPTAEEPESATPDPTAEEPEVAVEQPAVRPDPTPEPTVEPQVEPPPPEQQAQEALVAETVEAVEAEHAEVTREECAADRQGSAPPPETPHATRDINVRKTTVTRLQSALAEKQTALASMKAQLSEQVETLGEFEESLSDLAWVDYLEYHDDIRHVRALTDDCREDVFSLRDNIRTTHSEVNELARRLARESEQSEKLEDTAGEAEGWVETYRASHPEEVALWASLVGESELSGPALERGGNPLLRSVVAQSGASAHLGPALSALEQHHAGKAG